MRLDLVPKKNNLDFRFLSNSWYLSVKNYFSRYYKAAVNTKFPSGKEFLKDWIMKQKFLSGKVSILSVWLYL